MKNHTKIYYNFFGFVNSDFVPCEICGNGAVDIHHIDARGMGGNPNGDKDVIDNLQAVCRKCHDAYGDKKEFKEMVKKVHLKYMEIYGRNTH